MRIWLTSLVLSSLPSLALAGVACNEDEDLRYQDLGCAAQAFDVADKALDDAYKALSAKLDQEGKTKLKDAQRAWLQFRDADTALAYKSSGKDGALGGLVAANHEVDLTLERTRQLKDFLSPGGD